MTFSYRSCSTYVNSPDSPCGRPALASLLPNAITAPPPASTPSPVLDNHGNPVIYFRGTKNLLQQTHWVTGQGWGWVTDSPSDLPSGVSF
jgi:hypothetical protein